jgi:hypothetical protein
MATMRSVFGYSMAVLSGLTMLATVPAMSALGEPLITATGLRTAARYDGGEVLRTLDHGAYHTQVHRMVFDAFIGQHREGFIQVGWVPPDGLPSRIDEEIDADGDGKADFRVEVDTVSKQSVLTPYAPWVLEMEGTYRLRKEFMVRVHLRNPSR